MKKAKHFKQTIKRYPQLKTKNINIYIFSILFIFIFIVIFIFFLNLNNILAYFKKIDERTNYLLVEPQYIVTFNSNTGTGSMNNQEISFNETVKLNKNTYIKTGYIFTNWNTKADNTGISFADEEEVIDLGDTTLYAQWEEEIYNIVYNLNGGITDKENPCTYTSILLLLIYIIQLKKDIHLKAGEVLNLKEMKILM